jgi:hypothetical protein
MNTEKLSEVLKSVTLENMANGTMSELWDELPDMVSGQTWVAEIIDIAYNMREYLSNNEEISQNKLTDLGHEYANSEIEDYYSNINKRVQGLSLWAYNELDDEVSELAGEGFKSITDLNSLYLFCAVRGLWDSVARWATSQVEALEEVSA